MVILVYSTWAIGQFLDRKKGAGYLFGFPAYALGMMSFRVLAFPAGALIDALKQA